MQLKEFSILLDIKKYKKIEYIEVVKGDADTNVFNIQLLNGLSNYDLTGLKAEIAFSKSDGTTVLQDEANGVSIINNTEGKIQCTLKTNSIASGGKVMTDVRVLSVIDSRLLTSTRFEFFVRDSLVNDETIISTNEFPILNQLIATTEGLIQQVGQIEAQVPAQVVTDLNAVSLLANQLSIDLAAHKADIVQTDQVNNSTKYPSSAVTFLHGVRIAELISRVPVPQNATSGKLPLSYVQGVSFEWGTKDLYGLSAQGGTYYTIMTIRPHLDNSVAPVQIAFPNSGDINIFIRKADTNGATNIWMAWSKLTTTAV